MNYLNAQQLAFILEIKKEDARFKMVHAWCKAKGIKNKLERDHTGKLDKQSDNYPEAIPVEILSEQLNLPTLQQSVDDIVNNYLSRPASKKWILCDFPEKELKKCKEAGKEYVVINLPPALKSLLPVVTREKIKTEWIKRFPKARVTT